MTANKAEPSPVLFWKRCDQATVTGTSVEVRMAWL